MGGLVETRNVPETATKTLALVGQPNVGKSLIFFRLTGHYVSCSNYPGTTVELFRGTARIGDQTWQVLDTPGVVDLASSAEAEQVTRDLLLFGGVDVVLQVADAKNLERSLLLFIQLAELGLPVVLDLNLADERRARGLDYSMVDLARQLGVPVVETVATTGEGVEALREAVSQARMPRLEADYGPELGPTIHALAGVVQGCGLTGRDVEGRKAPCCQGGAEVLGGNSRTRIHAPGLATLFLALPPQDLPGLLGNLDLSPDGRERIKRLSAAVHAQTPRPSYRMTLSRQQVVARVLRESPVRRREDRTGTANVVGGSGFHWRECLGRWTVHPLWGTLILVAVLIGMYEFVGNLGAQVLVDWLERIAFGRYINPALVALTGRYVPVPLLQELLVGQYGVLTMALTYSVALILPIVTTFFLAFGFLEDSGYFPRLTVMAHRVFRGMGLSGQAVLPMILGLGCDTMATMTTRALETRKERVIATLLLALGVPCSAQLAVLLAMSAAVSPWVLVGVLGSVGLQLFIVGRLAALLLPGETSPFIMELPPLRWPAWRNIVAKTRLRLVWYVTEVVPLFVLGTVALFALDKTGVLMAFQALARPVVEGLLGLPAQAATAFVMGFFRRDYGAAGLYQLQQAGGLDAVQVLVSMVVITLFVPCIANLLIIVKERGWRTATAIVAFILPYAVLVGALMNALVRAVLRG
ncbi:MAG: ferrous iron transport protein B [Candidatus Methylomirabilales bacterium]